MTYREYKTELTELLDGAVLGDTILKTLLNAARVIREEQRDWVVLEKIDSSISVASGNNYATANALPATDGSAFIRLSQNFDTDSASKPSVQLVNSADNDDIIEYEEVPFSTRLKNKDSAHKFCIDYVNKNIYFLGENDTTRTAYITYIHEPTDIELTGDTSWTPFPERFHRVLLLDVAAMHELAVDYDDVNARMGNANAQLADRLYEAMVDWDTKLKLSEIGM